MSEVWKDIVGYEGLYQISNESSVRRVAGVVTRILNGKEIQQRVSEKILSQNGTYPQVNLCRDGVREQCYIHHLVAESFLGPRPDGLQVCHEDGNPKNTHYSNLRYDTPKGNASDRHLHGTHAKGEYNPAAKYTAEMISHIKHDLLSERQFKVAQDWNIPKSSVRAIAQGKRWAEVIPKPELLGDIIYNDN